MVELYSTATEFLANAITLTRGTAADITAVGVYHTLTPTEVPEESDFTEVLLVEPGDPLAEGTNLDVLSLVGPAVTADLVLAAGDWQRFVMVKTASETIIRKVDVVTIL
jgi:hypothetical protein